jgi:glycosyltransferase involved in cell wall biosynthesis
MARCALGIASTYPPREDGIAAFTRDLLAAVCAADAGITAHIAAITDPGAHYAYPPEVPWEIAQEDKESYARAAVALERAGVDVVSLQHEFGLWGAPGYLAEPFDRYDCVPAFLAAIDTPVVTTLHTVMPQPRPDIRAAIRHLVAQSAAVVVMARVGVTILADDYGVEPGRITVIPHGVPVVAPRDAAQVKHALRLDEHTVLSTFGLVVRNKGIETVIRALPHIVGRHPDVLYLVVGATHPRMRQREGESYRAALAALVHELGLGPYVRFINQYLDQPTLLQYLQATDIYITPYRDHTQITSGTLSYALGCGRAIVSTPYVYAAEALAEGRGLLADFDCPESIARCVTLYLDDPGFRCATEARALAYGREMAWPRVGERYAALFRQVMAASAGTYHGQ